MPQRNFLILLVMTAVSFACYVRGGQNPYTRYVASGLAAIDEDAATKVPDRELFNAAMQGMVEVLHRRGDVHSEFLTEEEADPLRAEIRQQFGGIGVRIRFVGEPPRLMIVGPPEPASPAARANLLPGDQILAIDDQPTAGMSMGAVLLRMRGQPGTSVRLTVEQEHEAEPRIVELTRELISIESILGDVHAKDGTWQFALTTDPRIAQVRITSFGDHTAEELTKVLDQLTAGGVQAVVLDLRDNAGGALDAAVAVCDLLLPGGKAVVETRGRDRSLQQKYVTTQGDKRFLNLPLAVIVNQNSASAAEIVAACLQDHGRAVVVGQRSYGKGSVQQLLPMESGKSLLKLTSASFWRPSGANIHRAPEAPESAKWGVSPNSGHEVSLSPDEYAVYRRYRVQRDMLGRDSGTEIEEPDEPDEPPVPDDFVDVQLKKAVDYLRGELERPGTTN
ncbi:MAG: S41 family peptidase [Pirellulales bacterium]